ncbi:MAG: DUF1566 domain-containing protein [Gammaproteobacteria bacterium]|nr:DUF1566 domain-containing protein [Gammaproteobacteria bacterium]
MGSWETSIAGCEAATTASHDDWRMPDVKELHSIMDYSRSPDQDASPAISNLFTSSAITNEGNDTDWGYYWASSTHVNIDGDGSNAAYVSFGRALGYTTAPPPDHLAGLQIYDVHGAGAQRSNDKSSVSTEPGALLGNAGRGV